MITIASAVAEMLAIVKQLCETYPHKKFTLDGRLVGDLGEILVEEAYDLKLYPDMKRHHDGEAPDNRKVQIKATMQNNLTFPADHVPEYYIGIKISADGEFTEIFNGPGEIARKAIEGRKLPKTNLHSVSISKLNQLSETVAASDRIPRRQTR